MIGWIVGLIDRACAVLGAVVMSQAPLFLQQYQHHLEGHVRELKHQMSLLQNSAAEVGVTLDAYIGTFLNHNNAMIAKHGTVLQALAQRFEKFHQAHLSLQSANPVEKPWVFMQHFNATVFDETLGSFALGFPMTYEGLTYACVGLVVGYLIFSTVKSVVHGCMRVLGLAS